MRLDHLLAKSQSISERRAKLKIASGEVAVGSRIEKNHLAQIDSFTRVICDGVVIQEDRAPCYLMLHKPAGYLSATSDPVHPTVLNLIDLPDKDQLHLAGRLDRASTGLILLTNDSAWSEALSHPGKKIPKIYLVTTVDPIPGSAIDQFREGFYFACEDITTRPARLEIIAPREARVTIHEGKYHQIKRMFHRIGENRLTSLHRESIGPFTLPENLSPGEWCHIDPKLDSILLNAPFNSIESS